MPAPALFAVAALTGAAVLADRTRDGSAARMTRAQAEAHKRTLSWLLRRGLWEQAIRENREAGMAKLNLVDAGLREAALNGADLAGAVLVRAELDRAELERVEKDR